MAHTHTIMKLTSSIVKDTTKDDDAAPADLPITDGHAGKADENKGDAHDEDKHEVDGVVLCSLNKGLVVLRGIGCITESVILCVVTLRKVQER